MAFTIFFFTAWLIITIYTIISKRLSLMENTFVFLIVLIVNINWSWIIYEEFKFIKLTETPIDYTAFLLNRSIVIPLVILIQLNLFYRFSTKTKAVLTLCFSLAFLLLTTFVSRYFGITEYKQWNAGYDLIYFLILHFIAFAAYRFFRKQSHHKVEYS